MKIILLFFLLLLSSFFLRGVEKLYEQCFLTFYISEHHKKREGMHYKNIGWRKKGFCVQGQKKNLEMFLKNPEGYIISSKAKLIKVRTAQKLYYIEGKQPYYLQVFTQSGFFKNIFRENRAVRRSNGAYFLKQRGEKGGETVALVVHRSLFFSKGYHLVKGLARQNLLGEFKSCRDLDAVKKIDWIFSYLKTKRIIHGDLTPKNILVHQDHLWLIDMSDLHIYPRYSLLFYLRHTKETSFCFRHFDFV